MFYVCDMYTKGCGKFTISVCDVYMCVGMLCMCMVCGVCMWWGCGKEMVCGVERVCIVCVVCI